MKKWTHIFLCLLLIILIIPPASQARDAFFSFDISGVKAVSYWDAYLDCGISGGLTILTPIRENMFIGGSIENVFWITYSNPNDDDLEFKWIIEGNIYQLGLYLVLRVSAPLKKETVNVFFQLGYGYFLLMNFSEVVDGCGFLEPYSPQRCNVFDSYQISGLLIGIGIVEKCISKYRVEFISILQFIFY